MGPWEPFRSLAAVGETQFKSPRQFSPSDVYQLQIAVVVLWVDVFRLSINAADVSQLPVEVAFLYAFF